MLDASFGLTDHRMLPEGARTRQTEETIDAEFAADAGAVIPVVGRAGTAGTAPMDAIDAYATRLSGLRGVARVDAATGTYAGQRRVGLTIAVLLDAFVIRATLVPAVMRLAGDANWWAPRPLRRLHTAVGLSEADLSREAVVRTASR